MNSEQDKIHVLLFREDGLERIHAEQTVAWFDRFAGPVKIETVDESISVTPDERGKLSWSELFTELGRIRRQGKVSPTTFIVLLTRTPNEKNWFAVQDDSEMRNGFIHVDDYRWMTNAPSEVISVHYVLKGIYNTLLAEKGVPWMHMIHDQPRGCLFDFCPDKRELNFKLRTADLCGDCLHVIQSAGIPDALLQQTVAIMEESRRLAINTGQFIEQKESFLEWPFPVAVTRHKVVQATNPLLRFMLLLDHFDCLVRFTFIAHEIENGRIPEIEPRPSLGWWVGKLRQAVGDETLFKRVLKITEREKVVNIRNERRGHGWMSANEESYRSEAEELQKTIDHIEGELRPIIENQRLLIPRKMEPTESCWEMEGDNLIGSHLLHPPFRIEAQSDPRSIGITKMNEIYLTDRKMESFQKISPFLSSNICPECQHQRILLTDGGQQYIDVFMGHRVKMSID